MFVCSSSLNIIIKVTWSLLFSPFIVERSWCYKIYFEITKVCFPCFSAYYVQTFIKWLNSLTNRLFVSSVFIDWVVVQFMPYFFKRIMDSTRKIYFAGILCNLLATSIIVGISYVTKVRHILLLVIYWYVVLRVSIPVLL